MADISKITVEGVTYDIKDEVARTQSVRSVNGQTGAVVLDADDVGALPDDYVAPVTSVNGMTGDVVVGGGGNYTATAPINIDANNDISHDASGVTAGTYQGSESSKGYYFVPSFTVDAKGHITSASSTGSYIKCNNEYSVAYDDLILLRADAWASALRSNFSYIGMTIPAGQTSASVTITQDSNSSYYATSSFRVADVQAVDNVTHERVIVDWKTDKNYGSSITLTVSIASAWTNTINLYPILTYAFGH